MYSDSDVKIAGNKPSLEIKKRRAAAANVAEPSREEINGAREWGASVASEFLKAADGIGCADEADDAEMLHQRRRLLMFTATVGFSELCKSEALCGIAQENFKAAVKKADSELYRSSVDTGAFSFYYLAYRRGSEVDRRIGQTFAMLCSHDGDPVYQELGEALYCWFLSVVRKKAAGFQK